jgi:hypothetical protein
MKRRRRDTFTPVDVAAEGLLRRLARGESSLSWLQARWDRIVGEPLARKIAPGAIHGGRLTLRLLDPAWRKPVEATLRDLERKLDREMPGAKWSVELEEVNRKT